MRRAEDDHRSPLHVTHISPTAGGGRGKHCQPSRLAVALSLSLSISPPSLPLPLLSLYLSCVLSFSLSPGSPLYCSVSLSRHLRMKNCRLYACFSSCARHKKNMYIPTQRQDVFLFFLNLYQLLVTSQLSQKISPHIQSTRLLRISGTIRPQTADSGQQVIIKSNLTFARMLSTHFIKLNFLLRNLTENLMKQILSGFPISSLNVA